MKRLYYLKDHLGSIRVTVDSTSNIVSYDDGVYPADLSAMILAEGGNACLSAVFLAEGMQLEGRSANYGSANEKYKFLSKERDIETGYDWLDARGYDSRIGRFLTVDPLADKDKLSSWSPYHYSFDNPLRFSDPSGMEPEGEEEKGLLSYVNKILSAIGLATSSKADNNNSNTGNVSAVDNPQSPIDDNVQKGLNTIDHAKQTAQKNVQSFSDQVAEKSATVQTSADFIFYGTAAFPLTLPIAAGSKTVSIFAGLVKTGAQATHVITRGNNYGWGDVAVSAGEVITGAGISQATKSLPKQALYDIYIKLATRFSGDNK